MEFCAELIVEASRALLSILPLLSGRGNPVHTACVKGEKNAQFDHRLCNSAKGILLMSPLPCFIWQRSENFTSVLSFIYVMYVSKYYM